LTPSQSQSHQIKFIYFKITAAQVLDFEEVCNDEFNFTVHKRFKNALKTESQ